MGSPEATSRSYQAHAKKIEVAVLKQVTVPSVMLANIKKPVIANIKCFPYSPGSNSHCSPHKGGRNQGFINHRLYLNG
jgi:hypothetical protein